MTFGTDVRGDVWQYGGRSFQALLDVMNAQLPWIGYQTDKGVEFIWHLNLTRLNGRPDGTGHRLTVGHFISTGSFAHQGSLNQEEIVVVIPIRGKFTLPIDGNSFEIAAGQLGIYQQTSQTISEQCTDGTTYEVYYVKMSAGFARKFLAQALHFPVVGALRIQQVINRGEPAHDMLAEIISTLSTYNFATASRTFSLSLQRRVIETFGQILLESTPHPYRERMKISHDGPLPRHVRVARDYMNTHALDNPKADDIAEVAQVSLRTLETSFRSFMHMTPTAYLRTLRLRMARDFILSDCKDSSIEAISKRFGFVNAGRFSRYYSELFGEAPSVTKREAVKDEMACDLPAIEVPQAL